MSDPALRSLDFEAVINYQTTVRTSLPIFLAISVGLKSAAVSNNIRRVYIPHKMNIL